MEKSVDFYTAAFGFTVTNSPKHLEFTNEDGSTTTLDTNLVFLKFPGQDFVYELVESSEPGALTQSPLFRHMGIEVKNIDEAFAKATRLGAEFPVPVRTVRANGGEPKNAFLLGPDGEVIELMQIVSGEFKGQ
jgi:catechol 2,3-dioxygenase-like lactoylglutathione lyase family enzyme